MRGGAGGEGLFPGEGLGRSLYQESGVVVGAVERTFGGKGEDV